MVCIHGITDTWRTWELVLPARARRRDVLSLNLLRHPAPPSSNDAVHDRQLLAHPARAARPPDGRRRELPGDAWSQRVCAPCRLAAGSGEGLLPAADRLGRGGQGPALATGRRSLPRLVSERR